jgi:hypothetical protein
VEIPEVGLQLLQSDMQLLEERMRDDKFARNLYRALADNRWSKDGETVALSWKRAEELINAVRTGVQRPPLELDQTGGEGELDDTVGEEFGRLGWTVEPLETGTHDPSHLSSAHDPPPGPRSRRKTQPDPSRTGGQ